MTALAKLPDSAPPSPEADDRQITLPLGPAPALAAVDAVDEALDAPAEDPARSSQDDVDDALLKLGQLRTIGHTQGCQCRQCPALRRVLLLAGKWKRLYSDP
jgi:hypothetical protein